jgi:hypothetical protein
MAQAAAHERELRFLRFYVLEPADLFNGFILGYIATQGINRIGRVNDNTPVLKTIGNKRKCFAIGISIIYSEKHKQR